MREQERRSLESEIDSRTRHSRLAIFVVMCLVASSACSAQAGEGKTAPKTSPTKSRQTPTTHTTRRRGGPLVAPDAGNLFSTYSFTKPRAVLSIAAVTLVNSGSEPVSLIDVTPIGPRGIHVIGSYIVDPNLVSPGTYRTFPPPTVRGSAAVVYAPSHYRPIRHRGAALVVTALELRSGNTSGTIAGIAITYRSGGREYVRALPEVAMLCTGDAEKSPPCQSALSTARSEDINNA